MQGKAGRSARARAERLRSGAVLGTAVRKTRGARPLSVIITVVAAAIGWRVFPFIGLLFTLLAGALTFTLMARRLGSTGGHGLPVTPQALAEAGRWEAGAEGEELTARLLQPLESEGWTILHDRSIPGSAANLDHLLIGPSGQVIVIDSKHWSASRGSAIHLRYGLPHYGGNDRSRHRPAPGRPCPRDPTGGPDRWTPRPAPGPTRPARCFPPGLGTAGRGRIRSLPPGSDHRVSTMQRGQPWRRVPRSGIGGRASCATGDRWRS